MVAQFFALETDVPPNLRTIQGWLGSVMMAQRSTG
jgi:hypothetical protein